MQDKKQLVNAGIVSIIVPCYNGEKYLSRCIDCIIAQSYQYIELILINDGSTDNSDIIVQNRFTELSNSLWKFKYISQKNAGVGAAVNAALKEISGEYLALLDVDDYMMPQAIEKKVIWLETHPDYAAVINNGYYVKEETFFENGWLFYDKNNFPNSEDVFTELINGSVVNWPGSYMIRTNVWLKRCPDREIFPSRNGQNMQILLPATYHEKTGYIDEPLMRYLVQQNSLSHFSNDKNGEKAIEASYKYYEIYRNVIQSICDKNELTQVMELVYFKSCRLRMEIAGRTKNKICMKENYLEIRKNHVLTLNDKIVYAQLCNPWYAIVLKIVRKILILFSKFE